MNQPQTAYRANDMCMIYLTAPTRDEAMAIGRALVREKLAACVNVLGEAQSIYRWQGEVEEAREIVLIAKTRQALVDAALARIKQLHSYEVPCAVAYGMAAGLPEYLAWMAGETR